MINPKLFFLLFVTLPLFTSTPPPTATSDIKKEDSLEIKEEILKKYKESEEDDDGIDPSEKTEAITRNLEKFSKNQSDKKTQPIDLEKLINNLKNNPSASGYDSDVVPEIISILEGK